MAEQTTTAAIVLATVGYFSGDYTVIVLSAVIGSLWPLANAPTLTRREGLLLLLRLVGTASVLTSLCAYLLERYLGIPASKALGPIALLIAALGDRWKDIFNAVKDRVVSTITGSKSQ